METETKTPRLQHNPDTGGYAIIKAGQRLTLTAADLAAIVQDAYNLHGIMATPSYASEAMWAQGPPKPPPASFPDGYLAALAREPRAFA